jgi:hypothetical protein
MPTRALGLSALRGERRDLQDEVAPAVERGVDGPVGVRRHHDVQVVRPRQNGAALPLGGERRLRDECLQGVGVVPVPGEERLVTKQEDAMPQVGIELADDIVRARRGKGARAEDMRHGIGQRPLAGTLAALHDDRDLSIPAERKDDTMRKLLASLFLIITLGMAQGAYAGPYEDAEAAYYRGDDATALSLFRPLAAQGNAKAQYMLGVMYYSGRGFVRDYKEAVKWYRLAAAQGETRAQNNLGFSYEYGTGVVQDPKEAVKWYRLAADQGDAGAQRTLGNMYDDGRGVVQDPKEAVKWYRLAAAQGHAMAQYYLGKSYKDGRGVPQDYVRAHMWFTLSAAIRKFGGGYDVTDMMTAAQIEQAQEMAQRCQASNFKNCD